LSEAQKSCFLIENIVASDENYMINYN